VSEGIESALDRTIQEKARESTVQEMMDYRTWRQRHEELLREAELSRRARALRAARKRDAGRRSTLAWEIQRQAGRILKSLRTLRKAG
jgi:hypothetical protein